MGTEVIERAPRVPPSPNSMAARFSALNGPSVAKRWLCQWAAVAGIAAAARQADDTTVLVLAYQPFLPNDDAANLQLALLAQLKDDAFGRAVLAELVENGVCEVVS